MSIGASGVRIAILATLDTKGDEAEFVADQFRRRGLDPVLVDLGTGGTAGERADVSRDEVIAAAGSTAADLKAAAKADAMAIMARGAAVLLKQWLADGRLNAVFGLGGGQGTWLAATVMRELPLGLPKVLVTTIVARAPLHVGASDIIMIPSITDIAGLNRILTPVLIRAVAATAAMAQVGDDPSTDASTHASTDLSTEGPLVAMTMFGVTTTGGECVRHGLSKAGHDVAVFHANGIGGQILERLAAQGAFSGVLDWTTTELADELVGGIASAGPHRLEAAGAVGVPQLFVPGAMDMVNFGPRDSVPAQFADRTFQQHTPVATLMRTTADENTTLGGLAAKKLNAAAGRVEVVIPTRGFSALSAPGGPFEDAAADRAFVDALRDGLRPEIDVIEAELAINDTEFAELAVERFVRLLNP